MKKKLLGIFGCILLLTATVLQVTGTEIGYKFLEEQQNTVTDESFYSAELGDDFINEIGIHWINDFHFPCNAKDLVWCDDDAEGLYNKLGSAGWTKKYNWDNDFAWEEDWKRSALGGTEDIIIDTVDLAYVCTHGYKGIDSTYFKILWSFVLNKPDDCRVTPGDGRYSWGNDDLEWAGIATCYTLIDESYWANVFDGLHLLLGCIDVFDDCAFGVDWGDFMVDDGPGDLARKIVQAWFAGFDLLQPPGTRARVIAEVYDNFNDYIHGQGYVSIDPAHDSAYESWDHTASSISPVGPKSSISEMMLYKVINRTVDETYVEYLGECFNLKGEVFEDERFYSMVSEDGRILQVDRENGIYIYHDLNNLWNASYIPEYLPSENESAIIAKEFLEYYYLLPEDAEFYEVISEGPNTVHYYIDEYGNLDEMVTEELVMDRQVLFARYLTHGNETFSVMGPGAKLKVYIGDYYNIIGVQGGWRDVESDVEIGIMTSEEAWDLFEEYGPKVCLETVPLYDYIEINQISLGYYEKSYAETQKYLIPAYIFSVDFYVEDETTSGYVYIPASEMFIPPIAEITSPEDESTFMPENIIDLTGDASFGTPPYTYSWSSSIDGDLGVGSSIQVSDLSFAQRENISMNHTITLIVTDSEGLTAKDTINLRILPLFIEIKGGFGVTATIKNLGLTNINNLNWAIKTDASIMVFGGEVSGIIDILPGEETKFRTGLILGLGPAIISVTVDDCEPITRKAFVILFFVLGVS